MRSLARLFVLLLLFSPAAAQVPARRPPPDAAAQAEARAVIEALFRADFAKARTDAAARRALALTLLEQGRQTKEDAALRFVALRQAFDLAVAAKETATALQAIADLAKEFAVDARR